jgi:ribonuclease P/MRP protein subunit RPP20
MKRKARVSMDSSVAYSGTRKRVKISANSAVSSQSTTNAQNTAFSQSGPSASTSMTEPDASSKHSGADNSTKNYTGSSSVQASFGDSSKSEKKAPLIRKLAPPRPFPTVPLSQSATGPRRAHTEGKNKICITRKTKLGAYMRRCKDLVVKDG